MARTSTHVAVGATALARGAAVALAAMAVLLPARADDPVNGSALFASQCQASCHGSSPLTSNSNKIYNGRNARAVIDAAIGNVRDMNSLRPAFPAGGSALADVAAYLGNTPTSMSFAATAVGAVSATQTATMYASLKSGNAISALSSTITGDFSRAGGTCGTAVATGTSCTVIVAFAPTAAGARSGTLSLSHSKMLTPITIRLGGTGSTTTSPTAAVAPATLAFATTPIGATSATQNVTVANTGSAALVLSSISLGASVDFTIAGGTCSAGTSLAAGANCTVSVTFRPAAGATGARNGTLTISHNAAGGASTVGLAGTASAAASPAATLTAALAFGSVTVGTTSATQTATLSNTGSAPLVVASISTGSSEFATPTGTCAAGASIAAGASCTIGVAFAPAGAGARSATLVVMHNAAGGQSTASLSGNGVALDPVAVVSPGTLSFSQTVGTTSTAQTVTLSNTGNAALTLGAPAIAGSQAVEFQLAAGSTCAAGASVAPNASCIVKVSFAPAASGARTASLAIAHNAAGAPSTVALNGTGTTSPQPAISLNAATLTFSAQTLGSASAPQRVTLGNSGAAPLTLGTLTLTGSAAADFALSGSCGAGTVVAVGASCTLDAVFTPAAVGARSATLTIASNAANGSAVLSLSGNGAAVAAPAVALAPAALDFGNQSIGVASSPRTVTLTNGGSGALALSSLATTNGFALAHNCGTGIAPGASCTLSLVFTPTGAGAATGSVSIASNAVGSPHVVSLTGIGVVASPVLAWLPAAGPLAFGEIAVGAAPAVRSLTLANQGPGAVTLQGLTLAGAQATEFSIAGAGAGACTVGVAMAAATSCTIAVSFQPGAAGSRTATLQVSSSGSNPADVALSGTGAASALAAVDVVPSALSFEVTTAAAPASTQTLTLQSSGGAVLRVAAMRVAAGSFTLEPAASAACPTPPFDLMPAQSCAVAVGWSSTTPGTETGLVAIDTNAAATPVQVPIAAVRATPLAAGDAPTLSNVGAGGCSIARGDSLNDPTLWLLVLLAACVLGARRAGPLRNPG